MTIWWSESKKKRQGGGILLEKFKRQMSDSFNCYVRNNSTLRIILTGNEKYQKNWFDVDDSHFPPFLLFWYILCKWHGNFPNVTKLHDYFFWPTCLSDIVYDVKHSFVVIHVFVQAIKSLNPNWGHCGWIQEQNR